MHHETTNVLINLRKGGKEATRAAQYLRTIADIGDQIGILNQLPANQPSLNDLLTGICFAGSWKDIWVPNAAPRISNSQKAINWFTGVAVCHATTLQSHANIRLEGGSGFAKVIATVRYEFKQPDPIIEAKHKGDLLEVAIHCEAAGLTI